MSNINFSKHIVQQYTSENKRYILKENENSYSQYFYLTGINAFVISIQAPPGTHFWFDGKGAPDKNANSKQNSLDLNENGIIIGPLGVYQIELPEHKTINTIESSELPIGSMIVIDTIEYKKEEQ